MEMDAKGLVASTLEAYRATLLAMGNAGVQVVRRRARVCSRACKGCTLS